MLSKRIIPCLDVKAGLVVKGKMFINLEYAGEPVELAKRYENEGADELVFLDIAASQENRKTMVEVVKKVAKEIFIPFTVGGGIGSIDDIRKLLNAGADKVSINTAAIENPKLISEAAAQFGSQCIVVAIDAKKTEDRWTVYSKGGKSQTGLDAVEWAETAALLGAGEILLTSIDRDGTKSGYDVELIRKISEKIRIPVIASGGAGNLADIADAFNIGKADAALAASVFHYGKYSIRDVKEYLKKSGIEVRL